MNSKQLELPISISTDILENNPKFTSILEDLVNNQITQCGGSKVLHDELYSLTSEVTKAKSSYLQKYTLYNELKCILMSHETSSLSILSEEPDYVEELNQIRRVLLREESQYHVHELNSKFIDFLLSESAYTQNLYSLAQRIPENIRHSCTLHCIDNVNTEGNADTSQSTPVLGILPKEVTFAADARVNSIRSVLNELRRRLETRFSDLKEFYDLEYDSETTDDNLSVLEKFSQFNMDILQSRQKRDEKRLTVKISKIRAERFHIDSLRTVLEIQSMGRKLEHYKVYQKQFDEVELDWLHLKLETATKKLLLLKEQIIGETYTPGALAALRQIRSHLIEKKKVVQQEYDEVSKQLEQYENLGETFVQLASEYRNITEQLENKKWAIEQLKQN
ncbi:uncharacterized protein LOC126326212 [Schistocerca gregaria]|uniref:uncharacterized protein LOC126326212 n=1 Tax=Schistocerca gregaria TaxID=7010 RepID=UPI00211DB35E|nr:uncharacterized protein LOC126326212 [Schistocerca gregaria]